MKHDWIFSTISNPVKDSQDSNPVKDSQDSNPAREFDGDRGCGCAKNKCLNLNCQCFRAEKYCHPHCQCVNCQNIDRDEFKDQRQKAVARVKAAREKSLLPKKEKQLPAQKCNCEREVSTVKSSQRDEHKNN